MDIAHDAQVAPLEAVAEDAVATEGAVLPDRTRAIAKCTHAEARGQQGRGRGVGPGRRPTDRFDWLAFEPGTASGWVAGVAGVPAVTGLVRDESRADRVDVLLDLCGVAERPTAPLHLRRRERRTELL